MRARQHIPLAPQFRDRAVYRGIRKQKGPLTGTWKALVRGRFRVTEGLNSPRFVPSSRHGVRLRYAGQVRQGGLQVSHVYAYVHIAHISGSFVAGSRACHRRHLHAASSSVRQYPRGDMAECSGGERMGSLAS